MVCSLPVVDIEYPVQYDIYGVWYVDLLSTWNECETLEHCNEAVDDIHDTNEFFIVNFDSWHGVKRLLNLSSVQEVHYKQNKPIRSKVFTLIVYWSNDNLFIYKSQIIKNLIDNSATK